MFQFISWRCYLGGIREEYDADFFDGEGIVKITNEETIACSNNSYILHVVVMAVVISACANKSLVLGS